MMCWAALGAGVSLCVPALALRGQMQPTDGASREGAAGDTEVAPTIPPTLSGSSPGSGIAAEASSMEESWWPGGRGASVAPISHR